MIARFRYAVGWSLVLLCAGCAGPLDVDWLTLPGETVGLDAEGIDSPDDKSLPGELADARNLERSGDAVAARAIYERLIAAHPGRYEPYHRLALVADRQRRHREAESLYTQAIRLRGPCPKLFNDLGYCLYLQGKLDKAENAMRKAVAMVPANSRFRNNLGLVLAHLGRHDEALEQFQRGGSEADAFYNLAFVHASQERSEQAKECFRLALASDPSHERSRRALASFQEYEKDPDAAGDFCGDAASGRWIPYVEGSGAIGSQAAQPAQPVMPTTHVATANGTASFAAGGTIDRPNTQTLLKHARAMMSHR
ncbi:MAG: tetratricopeptide repeat protein, partial [Candidatus Nealsonbacteria bacterium]|nr:tetratricopeptide repeat protein [Candidatus Nealsonbacteria bacterium]